MAWVAGVVDGEGCLDYTCAARTVRLRVKMTHLTTIKKLKQVTGVGNVRTYQTGNDRRVWEWCVVGREELQRLLCALLPYSVTKLREIEAVLAFFVTSPLHPGVPYSPRELRARDRLYKRLRRLKHEGWRDEK